MKLTGVRSVLVIDSSRNEPVLGFLPVSHPVSQALVVDDDEEVIVRLIALGGMRFVDPIAARIGAVEDDPEDASLLFPVLGRERARFLEFLEQYLDDPFKFALLGRGQMIDVGAHLKANPSRARAPCKPKAASLAQVP